MALDSLHTILKDRFGLGGFRPGQEELVRTIIAGGDCLGVMPTGAGKSLCYQVPAVALPGLAIVISPLVSLMADQVRALVDMGIHAAFLNSQLSPRQQDQVLDRAREGEFELMYIAPERLDDERFCHFARQAPLALIAVDEAHCVSQWGQDFRPSYLRIGQFVDSLPVRPPLAAFTATATPRVSDDIVRLLGLRNPTRVVTGFDRPNLHFAVEQLNSARKLARITAYAKEHAGESGIVYCSTRKEVEALHGALLEAGIPATRYHAGLSNKERTANQQAFVNDDAPVMVATNAFGMGIDKSNVRYVIHNNMPSSLEAYYQEAGRAGRDGEPAECLLLWADGDIATCRHFIESDIENEALSFEERELVRAAQRRRLAAMTGYCLTTDCLRRTILAYFGETAGAGMGAVASDAPAAGAPIATAPSQSCGNCSNCDGGVDAVDVTLEARAVLRCVHELRGRYGKGIVADVLTGSKSERVRSFGLDRARTYGILDVSAAKIKEIIELLTVDGYLEITEGRYPLVGLGPRAREGATDEFRLYMKRVAKTKSGAGAVKVRAGAAAALTTSDQRELFERLRTLRKQLADEAGVPPYVVFSDAHLRDMCVRMPRTEDEFLQVNGVGPAKLERYGKVFLEAINAPSA